MGFLDMLDDADKVHRRAIAYAVGGIVFLVMGFGAWVVADRFGAGFDVTALFLICVGLLLMMFALDSRQVYWRLRDRKQ